MVSIPNDIARLSLRERIGVSTLCLNAPSPPRPKRQGEQQLDILDAIRAIAEAGFETVELSLDLRSTPYGELTGSTQAHEEGAIWAQGLGSDFRQSLSSALEPFDLATVHLCGVVPRDDESDLDFRRRAAYVYSEMMRFGADIGVQIATMHMTSEPESLAAFELCRAVSAVADELGLVAGFEMFPREPIRAPSSESFGLLFDIGHAFRNEALMAQYGDDIGAFILDYTPVTMQFHAHGVHQDGDRGMDHCPIDERDLTGYERVVQAWRAGGFVGPVILEILREDASGQWGTPEENLQRCVEARQTLSALEHAT